MIPYFIVSGMPSEAFSLPGNTGERGKQTMAIKHEDGSILRPVGIDYLIGRPEAENALILGKFDAGHQYNYLPGDVSDLHTETVRVSLSDALAHEIILAFNDSDALRKAIYEAAVKAGIPGALPGEV